MGRLDGRVAIVTGGAGGLGRAFSVALAAEGAEVVVADIADTRAVVTDIHDSHGEASGVHCDVTSADSAYAMAAAALETYGRIDILVNNASILGETKIIPFDTIREDLWDKSMEVNVKGMWQCAKAVLPTMRAAGYGRIINIGSSMTWEGSPGMLHYTTSKSAVLGFTRSLARELAGTGITVNMITSGYTMTEAALGLLPPDELTALHETLRERRIVEGDQHPRDLVGALLFLASGDSEFVSGQAVNVDGGISLH